MAKFLSCLRTALDPNQTGHPETSLTLAPADSSSASEDSLVLEIICPIPGLDALKWPIYLKKQSASTVATNLVLPLVQANLDRKNEVQTLIQKIADKDAVITKLLDKLEAMGTGLEHVFTTLSGRKRFTRAAAEDRIKGLATFNERGWKRELESNGCGPSSVNELIQHVFGDTGLDFRSTLEVDKSPELDKWWHDFSPTTQSPQRKEPKASAPKRQIVTPPPQPSDYDDDDFQVQCTPPRLRSATKDVATTSVRPTDDASTDEEDDSVLDSNPPPVLSDHTRQSETTRSGISRLGVIGGKRQPASPRSLPSAPKSKTAKPPVDDGETASESSDDEATAAVTTSSPVLSPEKSPSKKAGLGRIGRVAMNASPIQAPEARLSPNDNDRGPKKFGTIGGKVSKLEKQEHEDTLRGRSVTRRTNSPTGEQARETSEERADRNRAELKRELERKAAAGPAKKKRRF
ncbi:hypothetical protein ED733_005689 [Metarhizium rileyi]|uniref:XLF-like coiled-coil region domain-containing protein n=1 Tax=Metarhizium rileyi (strain RCEF 4871) TaxID=1649241 RepID=A0A5C6GHE7_METRR|nr:hypothetical protein ED733_005689 [Metarhizium rileyi]